MPRRRALQNTFGVPIITDMHEAWQAELVGKVSEVNIFLKFPC